MIKVQQKTGGTFRDAAGADAFRRIRGYIAMLMDLPSLKSLKILIDEFVERAIDETEL